MINFLFLSLCVPLVTLPGVYSTSCSVTNFSSPVSNNTKITETEKQDYTYWVSKCQGLGDGWKVARINDSTEYMFINQFHRSDYYNRMRYYVGGRTTSPPLMETIRLNQTFGFSENDRFNVYATTDFGNLGFRSDFGNLPLFGVLCERESNQATGDAFSSATSYYRKLSGSFLTFSYWSSRCADLGEGWAPVLIETRRELDFIRAAQRTFSNIASYFIGGYTSFGHFEIISACSLDNSGPGEGSNHVAVSTWRHLRGRRGEHQREVFNLVAMRPSRRVPSILCKKAKN